MDGAPAGSMVPCHSSGWIQMGIFNKWFDHFVHFIKTWTVVSVLLIVDGQNSNTKNLDIVNKAREDSVAIVSLSPHCKNKMQPICVGFMKSLKHFMHNKLKRG